MQFNARGIIKIRMQCVNPIVMVFIEKTIVQVVFYFLTTTEKHVFIITIIIVAIIITIILDFF